MEIGIVSDELTPDFGRAVGIASEWGVRLFELRMLRSGRVPDVDASELFDVKRSVTEHGARITALSPGLFKFFVDDAARLEHEMEHSLPRTIALAADLGVRTIIVFGFQCRYRSSAEEEAMVSGALRTVAERAMAAGVEILVENEPGYWCDTGSRTASMIARTGHKNLFANWDPCNAWLGPDEEAPYPDGYDALKRFIRNIHAKDTREGSLVRCVPVGDGVIDWEGQLHALVRDGIVPHVTIETHCEPLMERSHMNVQRIRGILRSTNLR